MAMIDTYKAVKTLTGAGFTETQAEAMISVVGEEHGALATKADIHALEQANKAEFAAVRTEMQALELRMTLRLGALVVAAAVVLAVLELIP